MQFIRTLGHGSYGEVAQCEDLLEGGLVAVKRVLNVFDSEVRTGDRVSFVWWREGSGSVRGRGALLPYKCWTPTLQQYL